MDKQKIAVAVVHGVGSQKVDFAKGFAARLRSRFAGQIAGEATDPGQELQIRGVHWADVLEEPEKRLEERFHPTDLRWGETRNIMIDLGGDALAYQVNAKLVKDEPGAYDKIHEIFARTLRALVVDAGEKAPLCVVGHSLGTVIASNYIWDLQSGSSPKTVTDISGKTPLESGETLSLLYTMGSPIAVWSLRFDDFGASITFPPKELSTECREASGWVNFYDKDDVIAYPLKVINAAYDKSVSEDTQVNVGNVLTMWNPASHVGYWNDGDVVGRITDGLVRLWRAVNPKTS